MNVLLIFGSVISTLHPAYPWQNICDVSDVVHCCSQYIG